MTEDLSLLFAICLLKKDDSGEDHIEEDCIDKSSSSSINMPQKSQGIKD